MKAQNIKSKLLLLLTAAIWGLAFVSQRVGAKYVGPFTFNGIRFALGFLSLMPVFLFMRNKDRIDVNMDSSLKGALKGGITAGIIIFIGAALQQIGLEDTTAGKAAFITGLYIVIVPVMGIFLKQNTRKNTWAGISIAIIGLYLLCVTEDSTISKGDMFEIGGALFWAMHILAIDYFTKKSDAIKLCCIQFVTCAVLSLTTGIIFEDTALIDIWQVAIPLIYGGVCSVGVAYTLQVIGQKGTEPSHAAVIMSMETVFASLGGFLILGENLGVRGYIGCVLMFCGMLLSQLKPGRGVEVQLTSPS